MAPGELIAFDMDRSTLARRGRRGERDSVHVFLCSAHEDMQARWHTDQRAWFCDGLQERRHLGRPGCPVRAARAGRDRLGWRAAAKRPPQTGSGCSSRRNLDLRRQVWAACQPAHADRGETAARGRFTASSRCSDIRIDLKACRPATDDLSAYCRWGAATATASSRLATSALLLAGPLSILAPGEVVEAGCRQAICGCSPGSTGGGESGQAQQPRFPAGSDGLLNGRQERSAPVAMPSMCAYYNASTRLTAPRHSNNLPDTALN